MTERLEPTLSGQMALDDALAPAIGAVGSTRAKRPPPVSQRIVEVKSPLAPLALVAALIALALLGLLFWQVLTLKQERSGLLSTLETAEARIGELEKKLTVTGDESEQSLATLGAGIKTLSADAKENSSEIRKLWGVAHDRNRKAISTNKAAIGTNKKAVASANATVKSLQKNQQKELTTLQAKLDDLRGELAVLREVQESQQAAFSQNRNAAAEVKALKTDINSRISANEEAIQAIDAFRLQVNRRLLEMGTTAQ